MKYFYGWVWFNLFSIAFALGDSPLGVEITEKSGIYLGISLFVQGAPSGVTTITHRAFRKDRAFYFRNHSKELVGYAIQGRLTGPLFTLYNAKKEQIAKLTETYNPKTLRSELIISDVHNKTIGTGVETIFNRHSNIIFHDSEEKTLFEMNGGHTSDKGHLWQVSLNVPELDLIPLAILATKTRSFYINRNADLAILGAGVVALGYGAYKVNQVRKNFMRNLRNEMGIVNHRVAPDQGPIWEEGAENQLVPADGQGGVLEGLGRFGRVQVQLNQDEWPNRQERAVKIPRVVWDKVEAIELNQFHLTNPRKDEVFFYDEMVNDVLNSNMRRHEKEEINKTTRFARYLFERRDYFITQARKKNKAVFQVIHVRDQNRYGLFHAERCAENENGFLGNDPYTMRERLNGVHNTFVSLYAKVKKKNNPLALVQFFGNMAEGLCIDGKCESILRNVNQYLHEETRASKAKTKDELFNAIVADLREKTPPEIELSEEMVRNEYRKFVGKPFLGEILPEEFVQEAVEYARELVLFYDPEEEDAQANLQPDAPLIEVVE